MQESGSTNNKPSTEAIKTMPDRDWQGSFSVMLLQKYVAMIERDYSANISSWFNFNNGIVKKVYERRHNSTEDGQIKFVHPEDSERVNLFHNPETVKREYGQGIRQKDIEYRRLSDSGDIIYVRADMYIFEDKNGVLKSQTYIEDITESSRNRLAAREARRAQRELELKFVSIINNNYIAVYEADIAGDKLYKYELSDGMLSMTQLPESCSNGFKLIIDCVAHPEDRDAYLSFLNIDSLTEAIEVRKETPFFLYRRDDGAGGWIWCRSLLRGYRDDDNGFHLILCVQNVDREVREMEERQAQLQAALREAEKEAAILNVLKNSLYNMFMVNMRDGSVEILHGSKEIPAAHTAAFDYDELLLIIMKKYLHPDDAAAAVNVLEFDAISNKLSPKEPHIGHTCRVKTDDGYKWMSLDAYYIAGKDDERHFLLVSTDIDSAYRQSEAIEKAELERAEMSRKFDTLMVDRFIGFFECNYDTNEANWYGIDVNGVLPTISLPLDQLPEIVYSGSLHPNEYEAYAITLEPENIRRIYSEGRKRIELVSRFLSGKGGYVWCKTTVYLYRDYFGNLCSLNYVENIDTQIKVQGQLGVISLGLGQLYKDNLLINTENWNASVLKSRYVPAGTSFMLGSKEQDAVLNEIFWPEVIPEISAGCFNAAVLGEKLKKEGEKWVIETKVNDLSGGWKWCEISCVVYKDGYTGYNMILMSFLDITERKKAEDEIKQAYAEVRLRAAELAGVGEMFSAIYRLNINDDSLDCIHVSDDALAMYVGGVPRRLKDIANNVYAEDRGAVADFLSKEAIRAAALPGRKTVRELDYRVISLSKSGGEWLRMSLIYLPASEEHDTEFFITLQNIHERKEKEVELKIALETALNSAQQANTAKSNFLSNMSHDIRTPMNAIIGMINIAETHLDEPERVKDCLGKISVSASHLLGIINDVLDMSRIESGKMTIAEEAVDLSEIIHRLITIIQPQVKIKDQKLIVDTSNIRNEAVISDNTRLMQVFLNILSNAAKFTPSGGTIEIRISQQPMRRAGYGTYEFVFKDNGIGMSREFLAKLFMPFERDQTSTIKAEGTGLGMTITKNIVEMMGGAISCVSEVGGGTTFTVSLELKLQDDGGYTMALDEFIGLPALIVDDDGKTCENLSLLLEEAGMNCEWTLFGREAVTRAEMMYRRGRPYKLYLIDWLMPDMNGIETTRQIRKCVGREAPIFILTAYDWSDIEEEAKAAGVTAFLTKPLFRSNLYHTLREVSHKGGNEVSDVIKKPPVNASGKRILLAEDNEINIEIAVELLSQTGAQIICAGNGREAVDVFAKSEPGFFNIILMDIQMPFMNGYEAARAIRGMNRPDAAAIPIYAMTANVFDEDIKHADEAGMNGHVSKPISAKELFAVLRDELE
jgi:signal transduction histidine kinase/CheY-like chemotaxis protein